MDSTLSAFRSEVADWFAANNPGGWRRAINNMTPVEYVEFARN